MLFTVKTFLQDVRHPVSLIAMTDKLRASKRAKISVRSTDNRQKSAPPDRSAG